MPTSQRVMSQYQKNKTASKKFGGPIKVNSNKTYSVDYPSAIGQGSMQAAKNVGSAIVGEARFLKNSLKKAIDYPFTGKINNPDYSNWQKNIQRGTPEKNLSPQQKVLNKFK